MKSNKRIMSVMIVISCLFLAIALYLTYFVMFQSDDVVANSYNRRLFEREDSILRGTIYDRNGETLAYSEEVDDTQRRVYPYRSLYTHVIGYNSRSYGKSCLELTYNDYLLQNDTIYELLSREDDGSMKRGADLTLTIDHALMKRAESLMDGSHGAVVALNPKTGEVLCLYSSPSFNPNASALSEAWKALSDDEHSPFVGRAVRGLYAPGSTFKVLTAVAALENGKGDFRVEDEGSIILANKRFSNANGESHGDIGLKEAIQYSSNVYFSQMAVKLGGDKVLSTAEKFYIGKTIPFDIPTSDSRADYASMKDVDSASVGIGQGKLQVTPLNMALVAATIANDGVMMQPYLVRNVTSSGGNSLYRGRAQVLTRATSSAVAKEIGAMMELCVKSGTGTSAQISGITVAGKTGTAENEKENQEHTWFIGYAPADDPKIAVCVMKEYDGGSGSSSCAPIARSMMRAYLE